MSSLQDLVSDFVNNLSAAMQTQVIIRARQSVDAALGEHRGASRNGRVVALPAAAALTKAPRKKPPVQFCPVPRCTGKAAPIFGMVCAKHKDVSKTAIKKYREARRAQKLKAAKRSR